MITASQQATLDNLVLELRQATAASRVTVRVVDSDGDPVLVAESLAVGVPSMQVDQSSPSAPVTGAAITAAPTYVELERSRQIIVQNDCRTEGPPPPPSLIEIYRVYAQLLAPVFDGERLVATISVHEQDRPRTWTSDEVAALHSIQILVALTLGASV